MKEVRNKRLVLAGLVVLALLLAGTAAIAIFRDVLTARIEAQTGDLKLRFVQTQNPPTPRGDDNEPANTDIGRCLVSINPDNAKQLIVRIQNAYPGYSCVVTATVRNDGSIPARFEELEQPNVPALSFQVLEAPQIVERNGGTAALVFQVTVTNDAAQGQTYEANLNFKFRQLLPAPQP